MPDDEEEGEESESADGKPARRTNPATRALIYVTSLFVAAFVGAVFKDWWEAADPRVEIVSFSIRDIDAYDETLISLSDEVHAQLEEFGGNLPLEERVSFPYPPISAGDLRSRLRTIGSYEAGIKAALALADELHQLVLSQNAQVSLETRRQDFLEHLFKNHSSGNYLASALGSALWKQKPDLPAWFFGVLTNAPNTFELARGGTLTLATLGRNLQRTVVGLPPWQGRVQESTGFFERLLVTYDANTLVAFLPKAKASLAEDATRIRSLISSVQGALNANRLGDYILVEAVVSNRGGRPLNLRDMAVLRLSLLSDDGTYAPVPPIEMRSSSPGVTLIPGRESRLLTIWSEKPLKDLLSDKAYTGLAGEGWTTDKPARDSRLQSLLQNSKGSVLAELVLARAGDSARIGIKSAKSYPISTNKLWQILGSQ